MTDQEIQQCRDYILFILNKENPIELTEEQINVCINLAIDESNDIKHIKDKAVALTKLTLGRIRNMYVDPSNLNGRRLIDEAMKQINDLNEII